MTVASCVLPWEGHAGENLKLMKSVVVNIRMPSSRLL